MKRRFEKAPQRRAPWLPLIAAALLIGAISAPAAQATTAGQGYWHVISREWKKPPKGISFDSVNGGTVAKMNRHGGYCDRWEIYAKVRASHGGFSNSIDLYWETAVHYEPALVRDYYTRYQGKTPQCSEFNTTAANFFKADPLQKLACSPEAAALGRKPNTYCALQENPTPLGVSTQERDKIKDTANHALWSCGDDAYRVITTGLDIKLARGSIDDVYSGLGRVQKPEDYRNFGDSPYRKIPTAAVYEAAYGLYLLGGRSYAAITDHASILCGYAGPTVAASLGLWLPLAEQDYVMREFCGIVKNQAIKPSGEGPAPVIDPMTYKSNLYGILARLAQAPGASEYRGQDDGYACWASSIYGAGFKTFLNATVRESCQ